jgi:hypothetical protein
VRKYEAEASRNWDLFYKRNADRFFKDRCGSHGLRLTLTSAAWREECKHTHSL